jgi:hypothetical protein
MPLPSTTTWPSEVDEVARIDGALGVGAAAAGLDDWVLDPALVEPVLVVAAQPASAAADSEAVAMATVTRVLIFMQNSLPEPSAVADTGRTRRGRRPFIRIATIQVQSRKDAG